MKKSLSLTRPNFSWRMRNAMMCLHRTLIALKGLKQLIHEAAEYLMLENKDDFKPDERIFDVVNKK